MDVYANFLYLMWIICSWGYSLGFFQWDTSYSETVACVGKDANLEWKYTSNETISALLWEKVGSPDISIASYFGVTFTASSAYAGRINQTQPGSASVTLTSVTSSDNGTYRCTVQSTHMDLIDLIVAETPSGLPILNKTADTLICIPPQNGGTPNVETILKKNDGTILNTLTVQSPGTYHCCIRGSAVRCLGSTSNTATEVCVNETINLETTTAATTNGSGNGDGLSGGTIAGIVIAVIVIVCGIAVCGFCIVIFIKKDKDNNENKKPKGRKSSTVGPIDTPENKNGKWVEPNAQTAGRYSANSVTSRKDVVVDVLETKTNQRDNLEKSDTPRKLPPLPLNDSVTNDQEEKLKKKKKKKKKKEAKQEQNQQEEEGKDNTAFDNDQTENIPCDDTGNLETKTTPSNNINVPSDDLGSPETKTTPKNIDSIPSDDLANLETNTSSNNHTIPSDDSGNPETTTPSNNHTIPSDDSGSPGNNHT